VGCELPIAGGSEPGFAGGCVPALADLVRLNPFRAFSICSKTRAARADEIWASRVEREGRFEGLVGRRGRSRRSGRCVVVRIVVCS